MLSRYRRWRQERAGDRQWDEHLAEAARRGLEDKNGRIILDVVTPYRNEDERRRGEKLKEEIYKRLDELAERDEREGHG